MSILHTTHHPLTTSPPLAAHAAALSWERAHVSIGAYLNGSTHLPHPGPLSMGARTSTGIRLCNTPAREVSGYMPTQKQLTHCETKS